MKTLNLRIGYCVLPRLISLGASAYVFVSTQYQRLCLNHKRVYRIYVTLELNLRIKPKRRIKRDKPEALSVPETINQVWSMDFMSDTLIDGRSIRTFNVLDDYNREGLGIDVDLSLPSARVIRSLEQIIEWRGKPRALRCDTALNIIALKWFNDSGHLVKGLNYQDEVRNESRKAIQKTVRRSV